MLNRNMMTRGLLFKHALWWAGVFYFSFLGMDRLSASTLRFGYQQVVDEAKQAAERPFKAVPDNLPDFLKNLTYDQWRDIRFKDQATLWQNDKEPFKVRFFHPGLFYHQSVVINAVDEAGVHQVPFSPDLFNYGKNNFSGKVPADLGFAGFRLHYPMNASDYADEVVVFLGASYFRAVGQSQVYGLSARGLAVNTATDSGEEFPFFNKFWIVKPGPQDKQVTVYALLDSASAAGAYEFTIYPGKATVMRVAGTLFFRKSVKKLGLAPMTSMFFYGENSSHEYEDFRPQVHDSDGLLVLTKAGEWIWRPLVNPTRLLVNTFEVGTPKGFGLMQRDANFDHYQDLEARADLRPSLWVTPDGDWGQGHIELIQIPTSSEHNDNINVFWVPQKPPQAGETLKFSYTLEWGPSVLKDFFRGHATDTRVVRRADKKGAMFVVDFQGKELNAIPFDMDPVTEIIATKGAAVISQQLYKNMVTGGWRLVFQIQVNEEDFFKEMLPDQRPAIGLRAFLKDGSRILTETWDYAYLP